MVKEGNVYVHYNAQIEGPKHMMAYTLKGLINDTIGVLLESYKEEKIFIFK